MKMLIWRMNPVAQHLGMIPARRAQKRCTSPVHTTTAEHLKGLCRKDSARVTQAWAPDRVILRVHGHAAPRSSGLSVVVISGPSLSNPITNGFGMGSLAVNRPGSFRNRPYLHGAGGEPRPPSIASADATKARALPQTPRILAGMFELAATSPAPRQRTRILAICIAPQAQQHWFKHRPHSLKGPGSKPLVECFHPGPLPLSCPSSVRPQCRQWKFYRIEGWDSDRIIVLQCHDQSPATVNVSERL